jgi:hypothetical protein
MQIGREPVDLDINANFEVRLLGQPLCIIVSSQVTVTVPSNY